jgi:DNA repair photolyase
MSIIYEPKGKAREYAPLAANLYRGCAHGCSYCYAPRILRMKEGDFWANPQPRANVIPQIRRELETGKFKGRQVFLCFTCDPYQPLERDAEVTFEVLDLFLQHRVHWNILTKSYMASRDFGMYRPGDQFGMSLTFLDFSDSSYHEPEATPPAQRLRTLLEAKQKGISTWASLEPVIDPLQTINLILESHEFVDHYKIGKVNYRETTVDWRAFVSGAVELLEKLGKSYYIKDSLKKYL